MREDTKAMLTVAKGLLIRGDDINVNEIGELVEEEMNATQKAIEEGASKIQVCEKSALWQTVTADRLMEAVYTIPRCNKTVRYVGNMHETKVLKLMQLKFVIWLSSYSIE